MINTKKGNVSKCIKLFHVMVNSPLLETKSNNFKQKKATCTTSDELGGSDSEEDTENEEAMLCFMLLKK